jgi:hypothetical protein
MARLPTPEEIGRMLEKGEITRGEAIEMMDERARQEALQNLYGPAPGQVEQTSGAADRPLASEGGGRPLRLVALGVAILMVFALLTAALIYLAGLLTD